MAGYHRFIGATYPSNYKASKQASVGLLGLSREASRALLLSILVVVARESLSKELVGTLSNRHSSSDIQELHSNRDHRTLETRVLRQSQLQDVVHAEEYPYEETGRRSYD